MFLVFTKSLENIFLDFMVTLAFDALFTECIVVVDEAISVNYVIFHESIQNF